MDVFSKFDEKLDHESRIVDRDYNRAGMNLINQGEEFRLPLEMPAKVEGELDRVPFNGKGTIRVEGFKDDDAARRAGYPEWRFPGKNIPEILTFIDDKVGPMVRIDIANQVLSWFRAHKPGRLVQRRGVQVTFVNDGRLGYAFFEAGKHNWLLEYAINKLMGWDLTDEEEAWNLLTADTLSMGWPKEQMMKINFREHFFKNRYNMFLLARKARGRMQQDPAKPMQQFNDGHMPEYWWVNRYIQTASAIERHIVKHPELANLYPGWTADALATQYVKLMYKINYVDMHAYEAHLGNQVHLADIAGNIIGIGECLSKTEPRIILSYEHAVEHLQVLRTDRIDSPDWLRHDGGLDCVNTHIEWTELLLAGKWEEAAEARRRLYQSFSKYLKSKAKDTGQDYNYLWMKRVPRTLSWDVLQAYVGESVRRGLWKPVVMTPLRVTAPTSA